MTSLKNINEFMSQKNIPVAGVSRTKHKFGNQIYKELGKKGYNLFPVNPNLEDYNGGICYKNIESLPGDVTGIVINTKPSITKTLLKEAEKKGIKNIWLQQGSADKETIMEIEKSNSNVITRQCIIMYAEPVKGMHGFHRWLKNTFHNLPQ